MDQRARLGLGLLRSLAASYGAGKLSAASRWENKIRKLGGRSLIAVMCIGQVGNLLPHVTLSANLAQHLMPAVGTVGGRGGLMASGYAFGYMLAVPVLTTLTDRIDARIVLLWGSIVSGLATAAFGIFAQGFWSATAIWSLAGLGFAGAYMPGLKALTDRLPAGDTSRAVTLYTSSFSVGVGLSFLVAQLIADRWGWRTAFLVTGFGPRRHGRRVPSDAGAAARAEGGASAQLRARLRQPRGARLHPRLRRALLRALRHPHLAGRVLDVRRCAPGRAVLVESRRR